MKIKTCPSDRLSQLVYADYLEEYGTKYDVVKATALRNGNFSLELFLSGIGSGDDYGSFFGYGIGIGIGCRGSGGFGNGRGFSAGDGADGDFLVNDYIGDGSGECELWYNNVQSNKPF